MTYATKQTISGKSNHLQSDDWVQNHHGGKWEYVLIRLLWIFCLIASRASTADTLEPHEAECCDAPGGAQSSLHQHMVPQRLWRSHPETRRTLYKHSTEHSTQCLQMLSHPSHVISVNLPLVAHMNILGGGGVHQRTESKHVEANMSIIKVMWQHIKTNNSLL